MEKTKVCVTGGSGFLGSWLTKKLLERGYIVHATLRSLEDEVKVGLLKSLPNADTGLVLFKADIYNPTEFEAAIEGCRYVFHLATPLTHTHNSLYKDTVEAASAGVRIIADACVRSEDVKRLVYTGSVMASSPLKDDGTTGFKNSIDESCWSPLTNLSFEHANDFLLDYIKSKTLAEKELLSYNDNMEAGKKLEVVSLSVALVGGDTILSFVPGSMAAILSPLRGKSSSSSSSQVHLLAYQSLQLLQELLGCIPLVHIEDVINAHIFCIEKPSIKGRFICSNGDPTLGEMVDYYRHNHSEFHIPPECTGGAERGSRCDSRKLIKEGFEYKYDKVKILDDSVECARRLGALSQY